jgi:hypothetical protein
MAMKGTQTKPGKIWHPRELSVEQRNAIDCLIIGKTDQETADIVGVTRQTVQLWRTTHLVFKSELEQARGQLWRLAAERLRGLMSKALDNISAAVEAGNVKASFELLRAVGIFGHEMINHIADWRMDTLIRHEAERRVRAEGIAENSTTERLINLTQDGAYRQRLGEITAELEGEYGEDPS